MNSNVFHNFVLENCTSVNNYFFNLVPFRGSINNEFGFAFIYILLIFLEKENEFSNTFFNM